MKTERKLLIVTRTYRWSAFTGILIFLGWFCVYLREGNVPAVNVVGFINNNWVLVYLPFAVSRWWDILIGPIWSVVLVLWFMVPDFWGVRTKDLTTIEWISVAACVITFISGVIGFTQGLLTGIVTAILGSVVSAVIIFAITVPSKILKWLKAE